MAKGVFQDLTGQNFGMLTVLSRGENKGRAPGWICRCSCGNEKTISGQALKAGLTKSCGCNQNNYQRVNFKDLTGQRFTRWTVVKRAEGTQTGQARWECKCDCGNTSIQFTQSLTGGRSKSCGCLSKELRRAGLIKKPKKNTLDGQQIGFLTFVRYADIDPRMALWKCACGNTCLANYQNVMAGITRSCGCLKGVVQQEKARKVAERNLLVAEQVCRSCGELKPREAFKENARTKKLALDCHKCEYSKSQERKSNAT